MHAPVKNFGFKRSALLLLVTLLSATTVSMAQSGVGIDVTNPLEMLDVNGAIKIGTDFNNSSAAPTGGAGTIRWNGTNFQGWDGTQWLSFSGGGPSGWSLAGNAGTNPTTNFIGTTDNVDLRIRTNNLDRLSINSVGNVVIGTTAPSANTRLTVNNNTTATGARVQASGTDAVNATWRLATPGSGVVAFGGNTDHNIDLGYFDNGNTSFTSRLRIQATTGNVGIGTTSPTEKLDILNGNLTVRTNYNGSTSKIIISGARNGGNVAWNSPGGSGQAVLDFVNYDGGNSTSFYSSSMIESVNDPGTDDGALRFLTSSDMVLSEAMRIDYLGNVGIGANPLDKLHVVGNIRMVDGNQAAGFIPVSNNNGTMTWTSPSAISGINVLVDSDNDTKIQVEETADEDVIRFDMAGIEHFVMDGPRLEVLNSGSSVFLGEGAGANDNQSNSRSVLIGKNAGNLTTGGALNVAIGYNSLSTSTSAGGNTAVGAGTLNLTTSGNNTAIGQNAMASNTTGTFNTAIGQGTMASNQTGDRNTVVGQGSFPNHISGGRNVMLGQQAGGLHQTGQENIFIGAGSGYSNLTGSGNIFIGTFVGYSETGSNKLYIDNSNTATPLIYGDFATSLLRIHGTLNINNVYSFPTVDGAANYVLKTNGSGTVSWVDPNSLVNGDNLGNHTAIQNIQLNDFYLSNDGDNEGIRVDNSGNVGIGTITPADELHVVGNIRMVDGNQAANRVMTSDANGKATWVHPNTLVTDNDTQNTLNQAYDEGGSGVGRVITADNGAVRINGDDGFLVTGTFGTGDAIEATGAGTRMFFNPKKAALRAGNVNGTQWDDASIGDYSVALGRSTTASGTNSTALGSGGTASGDFSTAIGSGASASAQHAVAIGAFTQANGTGSLATGSSTTATGDYSTAMGLTSIASGYASTALGQETSAKSAYEVAVGAFNTDYTPTSTTSFNANDRIFVVGNGTSSFARSNALTIYKSGKVNINDAYDLPTADGTANYVMKTDGSGTVSWADPNTLVNGDNLGNHGATQLLDMNSFKITELATPTLATDAATKAYVDAHTDADSDVSNELQTMSQVGTNVTLSNGGGTISVADNDNSSTNEIQALSISGSTITLNNGGGSVTVPSSADNLGNHIATQNVRLNGNWLSNDGGSEGVKVADNGDIQMVTNTVSGSTQNLYLPGHIYMAPHNGGNISYLQARRSDNSGTTELQLRTYNSGTVTEAVRIKGDGNVAVGSVSPSANTRFTINNNATAAGARVQATGTDDANATWRLATPSNGVVAFGGNTDHNIDMGYFDNGNTTFTPRLRIQATTGNVGIATTTPSSILAFGGDANRTIGMERTTGTDGFDLTIQAGGAKAGTPDNDGGDLILSGGIATGNASIVPKSNIIFKTASQLGSSSSADQAPSEKMRITANGHVGIGTTNPTQAKFVVNSYATYPNLAAQYYNAGGVTGPATTNRNLSAYFSDHIACSELQVFSDRRIKDVIGVSDNKEDLETLMGIRITDYTFIDKTGKGNRAYKKVIAQEVEEVYPQAIGTITEVVPDIYQLADINSGRITVPNNLTVGEKVKLIFEDRTELVEVVSADGSGFNVNLADNGKVFVYGREVNDFRTVDYEALSTLNISASQELAKLVSQLQKENADLKAELKTEKTANEARFQLIEEQLGIGLKARL